MLDIYVEGIFFSMCFEIIGIYEDLEGKMVNEFWRGWVWNVWGIFKSRFYIGCFG